MPFWVSPGSRFQICPSLAKELEAGDAAIIRSAVDTVIGVFIMAAHMMQRRTTIIIEHIWRDSACKDSAERRDIPFACSIVDGSHDQV